MIKINSIVIKLGFALIFSSGFFLFPQFSFSSPQDILEIPKLSHPPKIDGILDYPLWQEEALKIEDFLQFTPKEKGKPSEKTVCYVGYDKKNLYFAFRCYDSSPHKIRATITNRDNIFEDDWIAIFLDTFNEKRRAFTFIINPVGIQMDMIRIEEGGNDNMDPSWDTVFFSDGKIDDQGYTVELSIPFKSLRFPDKKDKVWGFMPMRTIARSGEIVAWPPILKSIPGLLTQEGEIRIQGEVEKGKNFELMPIFTSLSTKNEKSDIQPGMNFKWGISSDLTMDLTLNPDFSHIEADAPQIDINQRFALYYPEKRPFFMEGMEIFNFPEIEMVYTRRIVDPLGGAKLTGKLGRFTYGLLSAYDTNPTESLWEVHDGGENRDKNALFNIFRMKADVFKESYVGFCLADKEINGSYNRVVGVDGQFRFKNSFFFSFQAIGSKTRFDEEETDVAPALYADLSYFSKIWSGGLYWMSIHPDFEASSGYINRVDYKTVGMFTSFRMYPEKKYLNQMSINFNTGMRYGYFGETMLDHWMRANLQIRFTEFSQMNISFRSNMERYENVGYNKNSFSVDGNYTFIRWLPFGFYFETGDSIYYDPDDPFLGWSDSYGAYINVKPSKRLQMGVDFSKQIFWEEKGGEQLYDYTVIRQRTTYQISKTLSLRAIFDYNHYYDEIYGSFLVSWILRPGTVFFLGVDNNLLREAGKYAQTDYSIFIKFSYWWRM
ncbi:MAG: carbohydrate binding family 9 domain-containing protein [Candidatus Aminicenantes bacterium]|nr:carbohydrate binding family 9 domain-containing protein [Candidatus Aminicenantes bacterium]